MNAGLLSCADDARAPRRSRRSPSRIRGRRSSTGPGGRSDRASRCSAATTAARCAAPSSASSTRWCCGCGPTPQFSAPFVDAERRRGDARRDRRPGPPRCGRPQHGSSSSNSSGAGCGSPPATHRNCTFPVCFELAVTKGAPAQEDHEAAAAVLRDDSRRTRPHRRWRCSTGSSPINEVIAALTQQLDRSWRDVGRGTEITGPFLGGLTTVLGAADEPPRRGGAAARLVGADRRRDARTTSGAQAHRESAAAAVVDRRDRTEFR